MFPPPREPHCVALYSFDAGGPGELSIKTDDVITLLEKIDADWIKGRLSGQEGMFPVGFVEIKVDLPPKGVASATPPAGPSTGEREPCAVVCVCVCVPMKQHLHIHIHAHVHVLLYT